MADSTIDLTKVVLFDRAPAGPIMNVGIPEDELTGASYHNVATAAYPLGARFIVHNDNSVDGVDGYTVLAYLKVGTQNPDQAIAAGKICVQEATILPYGVTNDDAEAVLCTGAPYIAVALSAMTNAYYGLFWVGGVAPLGLVTALATANTLPTEGNVAIGPVVAHALAAAHGIGLGPCGADTEAVVGWADAADA